MVMDFVLSVSAAAANSNDDEHMSERSDVDSVILRYSSPWTVSWASAETLGLPTKAIPQPHQHLSQPLQPASYSADLIT